MNNFLIGQFNEFNDAKHDRDYKNSFWGMEGSSFNSHDEIKKWHEIVKKENCNIGIHYPLRANIGKIRDPLFMSKNDEVRKQAFDTILEELELYKALKPHYILFHYPKPIILSNDVDWSTWRFGDRTEYVFENEYSESEFRKYSEELFIWLTDVSEKYGFTPVLELDGLNKYIINSTFLDELLEKYPKVRLCLDTGRLHLMEKVNPNFSSSDLIRRLGKYTDLIHLWNLKYNNGIENHHYPVSSDHSIEEGWGDIESMLKAIKAQNDSAVILFEHQSQVISEQELEECYEWVDSIYNGA